MRCLGDMTAHGNAQHCEKLFLSHESSYEQGANNFPGCNKKSPTSCQMSRPEVPAKSLKNLNATAELLWGVRGPQCRNTAHLSETNQRATATKAQIIAALVHFAVNFVLFQSFFFCFFSEFPAG